MTVTAKPFSEMTLAELHAEADDIFCLLRTWPSFDLGYAIMCGIAHRLREWIALREREAAGEGGVMDFLHRIVIGAPITPNELRLAGAFALIWFTMDTAWFIGTLNHWWGL